MIDDEKIIEMFFERSEQGIRELDIKYGKVWKGTCNKTRGHGYGHDFPDSHTTILLIS